MGIRDDLRRRAEEYAQSHGLVLGSALGHGIDGSVFTTESHREKAEVPSLSAVKAHQRESAYIRERDVYLRMRQLGIASIRGCHVPRLIAFHDELLVIEMTVVSRPFVLDFSGAYLENPPEFSKEVMSEWRAEKQEQFESR